jgi:DNA-binding response OmpR family regulator
MKALIYGQKSEYETLSTSLEQEGIEMQKLEDDFYTNGNLGMNEEIDLAIVDSRSANSHQAYRCIRNNWDIPVVLIVDSLQANWKGLKPMDADGYIPDIKKGSELSARSRALLRRLFLKNKFWKKIPEEKNRSEIENS